MPSSCIFMMLSGFLFAFIIHVQKIYFLSNYSGHYYFHYMMGKTEAQRFKVTFSVDLYQVTILFSPKLSTRQRCFFCSFSFFLVFYFSYLNQAVVDIHQTSLDEFQVTIIQFFMKCFRSRLFFVTVAIKPHDINSPSQHIITGFCFL